MGCNNGCGFGGGGCLWIILIIILLCCCCGGNSWGGNGCGCNNGCGNSCCLIQTDRAGRRQKDAPRG